MTIRRPTISALHPDQSWLASQQFNNVIDFLPDAIFIVDTQFRVIAWNHAMERLTGIDRQQVMACGPEVYSKAIYGQEQVTLLDYLLTGTQIDTERFHSVVQEEHALGAEEWIPQAFEGEGAFLWGNASILFHTDGSQSGAIQVYRDITTKKNTERSLLCVNRALSILSETNHVLVKDASEMDLLQDIVRIIVSKDRYRVAWIAYPDSITYDSFEVMAHAGFEHQDQVRVACENHESGCNTSYRTLQEKRHFLVKDFHDKTSCKYCQANAMELGYRASITLPLIHNDNRIGILNICTSESDAFNNDEVSLLSELADNLAYGITAIRAKKERDVAVTELRNAHASLELKVAERTKELSEANERLKDLDKLKSMFIASMSHELRTPLNSIIGFSGVLLKGMSGELNTKQKEQIERVYDSGKNLLSLISDVIDIAKLEGDRIEIYPQQIDIEEVVNEVIDAYQFQANKKNLQIQKVIAGEKFAYTDRKRLLQAVSNLVSNAVKYTEKGNITIVVNDYYGMLEICVIDTGIGIEGNNISRLFEAFERLDSHLKVKEGGSGLGLYLTQKLVTEILAGEVEVESEFGKGSVFKIRIARDLREV